MGKLKTTFNKAEDSPGFMLWKASNLLQRMHNDCLKDLNVTSTQFSFMTCLVYLSSSGPTSPKDIVDFTGMDKMMVSDLVKTLIKKQMLRKKDNPNDGRSILVEPTDLGKKTTNSAVRKIEELDRHFFSSVKNIKNFHTDLVNLIDQN